MWHFAAVLSLLTVLSTAAGQVRLDGLQSGYVVDEQARGVRPLIGIPGSAYLGPTLALPFDVRSAVSRGGVMIVISESDDTRAQLLRGLEQGDPQITDLGRARRVYLDDSGTYAILVSRDEL